MQTLVPKFYNQSAILAAALVCFVGQSAQSDTETNVVSAASRATGTIMRLHENATRDLVNVAQDPAFEAYFHTNGHDERRAVKERIDQISLRAQADLHVEEMCLIDIHGQEISRIVGSEIAQDLADDEASASFFEPGFATQQRRVYVAPAYLSADADRWVVAYVTPIFAEGTAQSILHYEIGMDVFQATLERTSEAMGVNILAVTKTGHVVFDNRTQINIEKSSDEEDPNAYFREVIDFDSASTAWLSGFLEIDDTDINVATGTVEDWTIVAWAVDQ